VNAAISIEDFNITLGVKRFMADSIERRAADEHDWLSSDYVEQWITRDITRDDERRPLLRKMLSLAPFAHDAAINVLDVGAGYGVVSEQVLEVFPHVRLTLQDYSQPMFRYARERLAKYQSQVSYVQCDLRDREWHLQVGGPFDLIVSGLAIHNLRDASLMRSCYRAIKELLRPPGIFLDYDLFGHVGGGAETHCKWLREAGFARADCTWDQPPLGIVAGWIESVT
jgi:SAM-dependent methyltransferase